MKPQAIVHFGHLKCTKNQAESIGINGIELRSDLSLPPRPNPRRYAKRG